MRILITGASGFIGSHFGSAMSLKEEILGFIFRSQKPLPFPVKTVNLLDQSSVKAAVDDFRPEIIVHCAAMTSVLACEASPDDAYQLNTDAASTLARLADSAGAKLIFLSSDQVYSGSKGAYIESDDPHPVNCYGRTKLSAEEIVLNLNSANLVVRSNSVVGPSLGWGESFSGWILSSVRANKPLRLFSDQYRSPIHIRRMVEVLTAACKMDFIGLLNVGGPKRMSRADTAFTVLRSHSLPAGEVEVVSYRTHPQGHVMPPDCSYNIARLKQTAPFVKFLPLEEEFGLDETDSADMK